MLYNLNNPHERESFLHKAHELLDQGAFVELKRKNAQRSLKQNKYLHLILRYYGSEFGYTLSEVKQDIFKKDVNRELFEGTRINKRGEKVTYIKSSSELDKAEMTLAIERFRNYSSAVCGFYIPAPDEHEAIFFAEQQVERYAAHL